MGLAHSNFVLTMFGCSMGPSSVARPCQASRSDDRHRLFLVVALTLDSDLLQRLDELVGRRRFRSRSQAVEAALADKLERLARTRLARESAKLNPRDEKRLADDGLAEDLASWPEY
jgi:Arc/MetJ-type ribon-helix-helix transcriptional regulator